MYFIKLQNNINNEKGSVMLETILVLPVYLIFITVIFFAGELSLYRNLLLQMDQHDLWNIGARNSSRVNVAEKLFDMNNRDFVGNFEITAKEKDETVYSNNGWWQKNALKNNAILKVPGWIQSVRGLISNHTSNYKDEFKLRENDEKLVLYSRSNNEVRDKAGENLCKAEHGTTPAWITIVNENYAGSEEKQNVSGKTVSAYTRKISAFGVFTGE